MPKAEFNTLSQQDFCTTSTTPTTPTTKATTTTTTSTTTSPVSLLLLYLLDDEELLPLPLVLVLSQPLRPAC